MGIIYQIIEIIGEYEPILVESILSDGSVITYCTPNFAYIFGGAILTVSIYSVFRIIGSCFGGRKK